MDPIELYRLENAKRGYPMRVLAVKPPKEAKCPNCQSTELEVKRYLQAKTYVRCTGCSHEWYSRCKALKLGSHKLMSRDVRDFSNPNITRGEGGSLISGCTI